MLTSHQKLVMESRVQLSFHPNCYHQITYAPYIPSYEHETSHYDQANVDLIKKVIDSFPWEKALRNLNTNDMIFIFKKHLRILFLVIFLMKQLHFMIEILCGLTKIRNS